MNFILIAVKDTAIEAYLPGIHSVRARGEALRNFTDTVNDPNAKQLHQHPEDFELWILGTLDDQTGVITSAPERLARGQDVKAT